MARSSQYDVHFRPFPLEVALKSQPLLGVMIQVLTFLRCHVSCTSDIGHIPPKRVLAFVYLFLVWMLSIQSLEISSIQCFAFCSYLAWPWHLDPIHPIPGGSSTCSRLGTNDQDQIRPTLLVFGGGSWNIWGPAFWTVTITGRSVSFHSRVIFRCRLCGRLAREGVLNPLGSARMWGCGMYIVM